MKRKVSNTNGKIECSSGVENTKKVMIMILCLPDLRGVVPLGLGWQGYPFIINTGSRLPMFIHTRTFRLPWTKSLRPDPAADINREDAEALVLNR